ncbi:acyltransferase family protein [Aetokthonos hydrillicola Thurmond2011]|jgi:fucose 4-O-acetylase-like acetyltransferase|uniref:Acyltransferase family protein n=1 Tax=Aetokthonos hydrillicola Thurmond2011 TaxID=2712845 RepID=A0AAP5I9W6_9CYAN|nr:acyltransferase family protein [Aetokthonos hydrillicola]MBO3460000.1 acyltransferase family protein [Aetokthonos hydrillicola CCALA 1050]MBW4584597.1 acyltransferase family protein [Aetokthonos hydrillicola CCALA 1050]MDR9895140.1 acyltransferase family protein [Aetokthonos hydrillicola Thurmond2011]
MGLTFELTEFRGVIILLEIQHFLAQLLDLIERIMKWRVQHIDIAKGIGILLVVFGHNPVVAMAKNHDTELLNIIYSFHMPLFFFLSGLFLKTDGKLKELMLNKLDSLIKPYFTTLIIMTINFCLFKHYSVTNYLVGVIYSSSLSIPIPWEPLWFLTHLWAVSIFSYVFIKATKINKRKILFQSILMLLLLTIGVLSIRTFWQKTININGFTVQLPGLPWSIDILFISTFFFLLGFLFKKEVIDFQFKAKYFVLFLFLFCFCHYQFNYTIHLFFRRYDHLLVSTLEACCGIYIVLSVSSFISKYKVITQIFAYIGSGSLFILIFSYFFQLKASMFFANYYHSNYFTDFFAFIIGSTIPLLIWELVKKIGYLSILFLPFKSKLREV